MSGLINVYTFINVHTVTLSMVNLYANEQKCKL